VVPLWAPAPIPQQKEVNPMKPVIDQNKPMRDRAFAASAHLPSAQREKAFVEIALKYPVLDASRVQTTDSDTLARMDRIFGLANVPRISHTPTRSVYRVQSS